MVSINAILSLITILILALAALSGGGPQVPATPQPGIYLPLMLHKYPPEWVQPELTSTPGSLTETPFPSGTEAPVLTSTSTLTATPTRAATFTATFTPTPPFTPAPTFTPTPTPDDSLTFAVIGDYGSGDQYEAGVAALVASWNVDLILTVGDNNLPNGEAETIDANIGQFYSDYIHPYQGSYGPGASQNRFFPTLGNHDWWPSGTGPYLDYFTLPGNERYYQFTRGPVQFFALDSSRHEPDGRTPGSTQAQWLQQQMAQSTSDWQVVYFHEPPFSSSSHGDLPEMDWPFKEWGVDLVLSGHEHNYERLEYKGLTYVIDGLGGDWWDPFEDPSRHTEPDDPVQSLVRFNGNFGALRVTVDLTTFYVEFIDRDGDVHDSFEILK